MHLVHKVNVTLLKLNVTAFRGKVSQPLILKSQDLILAPLDLGIGKVKSHFQVIRESLG